LLWDLLYFGEGVFIWGVDLELARDIWEGVTLNFGREASLSNPPTLLVSSGEASTTETLIVGEIDLIFFETFEFFF
jgi:hypothetical protein